MDAPQAPRIDLSDALGAAGAILVFIGTWMVFPPAALIVLGVAMVAGALWIARR